MSDRTIRFGLTLPNRGVIIGATTAQEMFALAQKADAAGWDSVWVGDSPSPSRAWMRSSCWGRWLPAHSV